MMIDENPSAIFPLANMPDDDLTQHGSLGQFSYAPATQTTVVTTTTTTTTSFPPLVFKGPRKVAELDSKVYPLASTPTPSALKKISFDLGGIPVCFEEAEDPSRSLHEVRHSHHFTIHEVGCGLARSCRLMRSLLTVIDQYKRQRRSLDASQGFIKQVVRSKWTLEPSQPRPSQGQSTRNVTAPLHPSSGPPLTIPPATSVSIVEAAGLAQQQQQLLQAHQHDPGPRQLSSGSLVPGTAPDPSTIPQHSPHDDSLPSTTPESSQTVILDPPQIRPTKQLRRRRPMWRAAEPRRSSLAHTQITSAMLGPPVRTSKRVSIVEDDDRSTTTVDDGLTPSTVSAATATPPTTDADLRLLPSAQVDPSLPPDPAPATHLSPVLDGNDASLPSPSLSPVTAALQHGLQTASTLVEPNGGDADVDSSFELPPPRGQVTGGVAAFAQAGRRSASEGAEWASISRRDPITSPSHPATMMEMPAMLDTFDAMPSQMQTYMIYQFLRRCTKPTLNFVARVVVPALKVDFLAALPIELGLNILRHLDFRSLCRAAQVSKCWRQLIDCNERAWKELLDKDGYVLPFDELQRAIREGWGWQIPYGEEDYEKDISALIDPGSTDDAWPMSRISSSGASTTALEGGRTISLRSRPKRKASTRLTSRKRPRKRESSKMVVEDDAASAWMKHLTITEGPYAAATAAAQAVPNAVIGLPSLRQLHLFKSIYRRHHLTRECWMQDDTKPGHIAFRAHQRHVVTCLQFDGDKIVTGSDDTSINVYDTKTGALRARLEGHEGGVWALQYVGNTLVSGSTDRSVRVWDIDRGVCTQVFQRHTSTVRCLKILLPTMVKGLLPGSDGQVRMMPTEPLIITGSRDSTLRVWKLPGPEDEPSPPFTEATVNDAECPYFIRTLAGHQHSVRAIAAYGDTLVSGSYDCTVRVWSLSTGESVFRLQGHTQKVYSVVLDHQRSRCISGSMDNTVKVWSLETGAVLFNLDGHASLVGLLDLSHDVLVSAAADATLRVWDPAVGQCRGVLSEHTGAITCFQHDGQKVISGSDRAVKLWDVRSGQFVRDLLTDLNQVWQVKFNDRRCVAAVQRNNLTYIEVSSSSNVPFECGVQSELMAIDCGKVLDFGSPRDALPKERRSCRIVVDALGQEVIEGNNLVVEGNHVAVG